MTLGFSINDYQDLNFPRCDSYCYRWWRKVFNW